MTHTSAVHGPMNFAAKRRQRRIERQLLALRTMQQHLRTKDIVCAVLAIPVLVGLCLAVAVKLHMFAGSTAYTIVVPILCGAGIWWIGRKAFWVAVLIVYALLLILFEDVPGDLPDFGTGNNKEVRRIKVERVIAKREAMLKTLGQDFR